jgi:hypothetical protein
MRHSNRNFKKRTKLRQQNVNSALPCSGYGGRSCCKNPDLDEFDAIVNQKLGTFQRILRGDSFRIHSIQFSPGSMPPARILDLAVSVHRETHELEFSWTAPGDDYDHGQSVREFVLLFLFVIKSN